MVSVDIRVVNANLERGGQLDGEIDLRGILTAVDIGEVLKLGLVAELIVSFGACAAVECLIALIDESGKPCQKSIYKLIFVSKHRLIVEYVEQLRGDDLAVILDLKDIVGMLSKVLNGLFADMLRELDGKHLVNVLDGNSGRSDYNVERGESSLYFVYPFDIDALMHRVPFKRGVDLGCGNDHFRISEFGAILCEPAQRGERFRSEFFVIAIHKGSPFQS